MILIKYYQSLSVFLLWIKGLVIGLQESESGLDCGYHSWRTQNSKEGVLFSQCFQPQHPPFKILITLINMIFSAVGISFHFIEEEN